MKNPNNNNKPKVEKMFSVFIFINKKENKPVT